jgi:hypothetical protein
MDRFVLFAAALCVGGSLACLSSGQLVSSFPQDLLYLFSRHWEIVLVLAQSRGKVLLDRVRPLGIDLSGGVLLLAQTLMTEGIF